MHQCACLTRPVITLSCKVHSWKTVVQVLCLLLQPLRVHSYSGSVDLENFAGVFPPIWLLHFLPLLPWTSLCSEGRDLMDKSQLGLNISKLIFEIIIYHYFFFPLCLLALLYAYTCFYSNSFYLLLFNIILTINDQLLFNIVALYMHLHIYPCIIMHLHIYHWIWYD